MPGLDADYYALLRVDPSADSVTIRTAWGVEQRLWGVRQNASDLATRQEAERHVLLLGLIRDVLLDPNRRAKYDRQLHQCKPVPLVVASPALSPRRTGTGRGSWMLKPLAFGSAGVLITGSQIFHWDLVSFARRVLANMLQV